MSSNSKAIPAIPGPRRTDENPQPGIPPQRTGAYDEVVLAATSEQTAPEHEYGRPYAHGCF